MIFNKCTFRKSYLCCIVGSIIKWFCGVETLRREIIHIFSRCLKTSIRYFCLIALCSWLNLDVSYLSDGLVDCLDPDCCLQSTCQNSLLCRGSRDPLDIIQQSHSGSPAVKSFYDRIKLLVGKDSTHIIPGENPFNSR